MAKLYHIGKNGPAPCRATVGECPLGGKHFGSEKAAYDRYAEVMSGQVFGTLTNEPSEEARAEVATLTKLTAGRDLGFQMPSDWENEHTVGRQPATIASSRNLQILSDELEDEGVEIETDWADDDRNVLRSISLKQSGFAIENRGLRGDMEDFGYGPDDEREARAYYYG